MGTGCQAGPNGRMWEWYGQCPNCKKRTIKSYNDSGWMIYCTNCGHVVEKHTYTQEELENMQK